MSFGDFFGKKGRSQIPSVSPLFLTIGVCILIIILGVLIFIVKSWVNVSPGEIAIFVKKTGELPPPGTIVADSEDLKGVQKLVLSEGWHFMNYFVWERVDISDYSEKIKVPEGKCRIRVRLTGERLDIKKNDVIAYGDNEKGITSESMLLKPGTHAINRLEYFVTEEEDPVRIPSGFAGVDLYKAGAIPDNPNVFVVPVGNRGVQKQTLSPMTKFINRYERWIYPIDMRSQIYKLGGKAENTRDTEMVGNPISFPSKDGFQISLEGKIEWKIDPKRAAEVFVKYVDNRPVITCVVEKIILPNTRSFTRIYGSMEEARNFIEGSTRQHFQKKLFTDLQKHCQEQGILIINVSITEMLPPKEIATLINQREVAKRFKAKYRKEKDREIQEKQLAMEKKKQDRNRLTKEMEAKMSVMKTKAQQDKKVAEVEAQKKLSVAKLQLEASRKLANAILSRGKAKADIIGYNNIAVSAGIRKAAEAFRSGESYARYLFLKKVAPGFLYILANTDGPFIKVFQELFEKGGAK